MSWPAMPAGWATDGTHPVDPYACWAAATAGVYLANDTDSACRVALRRRPDVPLSGLRSIPGVTVPAVYPEGACHCTAEVGNADATTWPLLHEAADVLLAEPGLAAVGHDPVPRVAVSGGAPVPSPASGPAVVIGVVDGACGFAHRRFRYRTGEIGDGPWRTRLLAYWDQSTDAAGLPGWTRPDDLGYGRELLPRDEGGLEDLLNRHLADATQDGNDEEQAFGERQVYRALGVRLPVAADWSHGTHVLDVAAGLRPPDDEPVVIDDRKLLPTAAFDVDRAALAFVQLPEVALLDTSGRWMAAAVLDAARFIIARAPRHSSIVINLSLGSFAGPHDGTSMIEQALDQLVKDFSPRLHIVVAAGNAGEPHDDGDGGARPCHATATLAAAGSDGARASFALRVDEADSTETFVELWLANTQPAATDVPSVSVELLPPVGPSVTAEPGRVSNWPAATDVVQGQIVNQTGAGGDGPRGRRPMVLVALGASRDAAGPRVPTGTWRIQVTNSGVQAVEVEAWVERRDVPGELPDERPQYGFVAGDRTVVSAANTLGSLAHGAKSIVVGAAEFAPDFTDTTPSFASRGPDRSTGRPVSGNGPAVRAPCELAAAGFLSGSRKTLKGTSMSAAWVTRCIAARLLREAAPVSREALIQWLQAGAIEPSQPGKPAGGTGASRSFVLPAA